MTMLNGTMHEQQLNRIAADVLLGWPIAWHAH